MSNVQSPSMSDFYYLIKSTDIDRAKRVKAWKITQNTFPHPICAVCGTHCTSFDYRPSTTQNTAFKKTKRWRDKLKMDKKFFENMVIQES